VLRRASTLKPRDQFAHGVFALGSEHLLQQLHLAPSLGHHLAVQLVLLTTLLPLQLLLRVEHAELLEILPHGASSSRLSIHENIINVPLKASYPGQPG